METHSTKINIHFELIRYWLFSLICPYSLQMTIALNSGLFWPTIDFTRESESDNLHLFCKCLCSLGKLIYLIINDLKLYLDSWFSGYAYLHDFLFFSKDAVIDMTLTFLVLITTLAIRSTQNEGNLWWIYQILTML